MASAEPLSEQNSPAQQDIAAANNLEPNSPGAAPESSANTNLADALYTVARMRLDTLQREKGARSQAARRHKLTVRFTNTSIVLLSTYIFGISVILTVLEDFIQATAEMLRATNLTMSFFLVAFSLLQSFKRHDLRSELFSRSAQSLRNVRSDLQRELILGKLTPKAISEFDEHFKRILRSYRDAHGEMDAKVFQFRMERDFGTPLSWRRLAGGIFWQSIWIFYVIKSFLFAALLPFLIYLVYRLMVGNVINTAGSLPS